MSAPPPPSVERRRAAPPTAAARRRALPHAHQFVALHEGLTHYRIDGPPQGRVVLLVHGATVPAWEFERLLPLLAAAGLRTVCVDLFGHGYSDRPRCPHDHGLFVRQLCDLLDVIEATQPVHVVGHSLGAALAARLAVARPGRVDRLALVAPLIDFTACTPSTRLLRVPLLGECLTHGYVVPMLVRRRRRNYAPIDDGRFTHRFEQQLAVPGFGRALLSMFRANALADQRDAYLALDREPHAVLVVRGVRDSVVSAEQIDQLRAWLPRARYQEFPGLGHPLLLTDPAVVAPDLIAFLRGAAR